MRTAALSPHSGIPAPILRTTRSLQICQCRHASDHAATAIWEPSRPVVPKMTTRHLWTRAALHLWLTPLFAPTAPAQVSRDPKAVDLWFRQTYTGYGGTESKWMAMVIGGFLCSYINTMYLRQMSISCSLAFLNCVHYNLMSTDGRSSL